MAKDIKTTDPQGELLIQVDKNNNNIGSIERGAAHKTPGIYYRTLYVLIRNKQGKILLQKRSPTKDLYPNCWDLSVGGHVNWGQSYKEAAQKEIKEEVGVNTNLKDLVFKGEVLVRLPNSNEFFHVFEYTLKSNDVIVLAKDEISKIKWMTIKDIKESMKRDSLHWYERPLQVVSALY
jgi:isopentenyldiphosphate isomerase